VRTTSGATAVRLAESVGGRRRIVRHVGSAHDEAELGLLMAEARRHVPAAVTTADEVITERHDRSVSVWRKVRDGPAIGQAPFVRCLLRTDSGPRLKTVVSQARRSHGFPPLGAYRFGASSATTFQLTPNLSVTEAWNRL
jgi:hypothetical protein